MNSPGNQIRSNDANTNPAGFKRLFECGRRLIAEKNMDDLLCQAMDLVVDLSGAERGWMSIFREHGREKGYEVLKNMDKRDFENPGFEYSRAVIEKVKADGTPVFLRDVPPGASRKKDKRSEALNVSSVICLPLTADKRVFGMVYLDKRRMTGMFTDETFYFILEFTAFISTAVCSLSEQQQLQYLASNLGKTTADQRKAVS